VSIQPDSPEARRAAQKLLHAFLFLAALNVVFLLYVFFISEDGEKTPKPPKPVATPGDVAPVEVPQAGK
jgi:hypothetical protein